MKNTPALILVTIFSLTLPTQQQIARAAPKGSQFITYANGKRVGLNPKFAVPMQCVSDKLFEIGYRPRDIGCFGYRPNNRSAHPTGHACDVDQTGRDRTRLLKTVSRSKQIAVAKDCKAVSGCVWRNPDCGHFEQMSAPYSRSGTRIGIHYYGETPRKTKKRRRA